MKKTRNIIMALCLMALAWGSASCKKTKNENIPHEGEEITLGATIEQPNDDNKAFVYEESGGIVNVYWSSSEKIDIFGNQQQSGTSGVKVFDIVEGAGTTKATFKGEAPQGGMPYYAAYPSGNCTGFNLTNKQFTFTIPAESSVSGNSGDGTYSFIQTHSIPMVGYSKDGKSMAFKNTMSTIFLKLKGTAKVTKIVLTDLGNRKLDGTLTVTLNVDGDGNATISSSTLSGGSSSSLTLNLGDGVQLDESKYSIFCFPVPKGAFAGNANNVKVRIYDERGLALMDCKKLQAGVSSDSPMAYRLVEDNVNPTPLTLRYPFSINSSEQVYFSRGNLWYNSIDRSFHFEKNQWDADKNNWNTAVNTNHHLGHFYWSNNVTNAVAKNHPNSITSTIFTNNSDTQPLSSFTVEGVTGKFYILQQYDKYPYWEYLVGDDRTSTVGTSGKKLWGMGTVNGVKGLILLPDNWNVKNYSTFSYATRKCSSNVYSGDTWENMEYDGAVFMPIAGVGYEGDGTISDPDEGAYWPSHYNSGKLDEFYFIDNNSSYDPKVYYLDDDESLVYWCSIRLVSNTP